MRASRNRGTPRMATIPSDLSVPNAAISFSCSSLLAASLSPGSSSKAAYSITTISPSVMVVGIIDLLNNWKMASKYKGCCIVEDTEDTSSTGVLYRGR